MTALLVGTTLFVSCLYLLTPIRDNDFFWHLKTGEWIYQHLRLPSEDLFSYTTPVPLGAAQHFTLTAFWISQLIYAALYRHFGMSGIVGLRFVVFAALLYFMVKRRRGDNVLYSCLLLVFAISLLSAFPLERPHAFSFLFFAALLFLLERRTSGPGSRLFPDAVLLPALMLVWANSHGGFLLGQVIITLFIVMEGLKFLHPSLRPMNFEAYKSLLIVGVLGIVFSLMNPNTYHGFEMLRLNSFTLYVNKEYKSTLEAFRYFSNYAVFLWWSIMLLTFIGLTANRKNTDITQIALFSGLGYFSFTHVRYVPFFLIAALPVICESFSKGRPASLARTIAVPAALLIALVFARDEVANLKNLRSGHWIDEERFPVRAADFIAAHNLTGNMFNHFDWGGYLLWRLAPERKVFVDGRCLNEEVDWQAYAISLAYAGKGRAFPEWKRFLRQYDIRYVVIPPMFSSGRIFPLANELMKSADWTLVLSDFNSLVFVRNGADNAEIIRNYSLPKMILYR